LRLQHFITENGKVTTPDEFRDNQIINIQVGQILHPTNNLLEVSTHEEGRDLYNIQSPIHHNVPARLTITAETRVRSGSSKTSTPTHTQVDAASRSFHAPHVGEVFNAPGASGVHSRHGSSSRPPSAPSSGRARGPSAFTFDSTTAAISVPPALIESAAESSSTATLQKKDSDVHV